MHNLSVQKSLSKFKSKFGNSPMSDDCMSDDYMSDDYMSDDYMIKPCVNTLPIMPCSVLTFEPDTSHKEILNYVVLAYALYIAIKKCKSNGQINGSAVILAYLFAPCFIVYRLIKPCV